MNLKGAKSAKSLVSEVIFLPLYLAVKVVSDSHRIRFPENEPEAIDMIFVSIAIKANNFFALRYGFRLPCSRISFKENVTGSSSVSKLDSVDVLHACHLDCNVCDRDRFALSIRHSEVHSKFSIDVAPFRCSQLIAAYSSSEVELD